MQWSWLMETKIILAAGITFMTIATIGLIVWGANEKFVMVFSSFIAQLVAALLTYITKGIASNDTVTRKQK